MKKVLVLLMALIMSISILSACKKDSVSEEDKQTVKEIISIYIESLFNGDIDALNFVAEGTGYLRVAEETLSDQREMLAAFEENISIPDDRVEEARKIRGEALKKYTRMYGSEIKDAKVHAEKAEVTVRLTAPDVSRVKEFREYAEEESKKGFSQAEIRNILSAENMVDIPRETFLKAEKLWFEAFVKKIEKTVCEKEITYELKMTDSGWLIAGDRTKKIK